MCVVPKWPKEMWEYPIFPWPRTSTEMYNFPGFHVSFKFQRNPLWKNLCIVRRVAIDILQDGSDLRKEDTMKERKIMVSICLFFFLPPNSVYLSLKKHGYLYIHQTCTAHCWYLFSFLAIIYQSFEETIYSCC